MKIPYSYKKHAFGTLLGVSIAGHALAFSLGGFVVPEPQYAVEEASSSIEIVMIEQTKVVVEEKKTPEVKPVLTTQEPVEEHVEKVEEIIEEIVEPPVIEEEVLEDIEEKEAVVVEPEKGARTDAKPDYLKNKPPLYPHLARERAWEGTVLLKVLVEKTGLPSTVELKKSSGHRILDRAAIRAVKKWRFLPARVGNLALSSEIEIPVRFVLED